MTSTPGVFLGTDSGATTSKTGGVWADGTTISTKLRQSATNAQLGTPTVLKGWIDGISGYLSENSLIWGQVQGVGLAIPGPYLRYGVLGHSANLPPAFSGWDFYSEYSRALAEAAGRPIPLVVGNDGKCGGIAEAKRVRGDRKASVLMFAPGSGLGGAYIDKNGLPLEGDTLSGMEIAHMPAPLHLLGATRAYPCGCGRKWGCMEAYTTLSGLPHLLEDMLKKYPDHELGRSPLSAKEKVFSLRGRAQSGDPLAVEIFDFQARALGFHVAALALALDPEFVVIGGGLMDTGATTQEFRDRYLRIIRETAEPYFWPVQRSGIRIVAATLGDLSQAIGAALAALYTAEKGR